MSIAQQAARITSLRDELRDILKELGLADEQYKLEQCVEAVRNMPKIPAEDTVLDINNTEKQIDKGYHLAEGRVHIVTEEKTVTQNGTVTPSEGKVLSKIIVNVDNSPNLQEKTVSPSKEIQTVVSDEGYDGLSKVIIEAIADIYADISGVTASAEDVLEGKSFVSSAGENVAGAMKNMADSGISIDGMINEAVPIPSGFYNGMGYAKITDSIENELAAL